MAMGFGSYAAKTFCLTHVFNSRFLGTGSERSTGWLGG